MKKIRLVFMCFAAILVLCSCAKKEKMDTDIVWKASEHAELNFGYDEGEKVIKDFTMDENGNIYILQKNGTILTYTGSGTFEKEWDLNLEKQGLTAYRMTCANGKIYLIDGHNNAIITVEKGRVKKVSLIKVSDVGMVKNFYAEQSGMLIMSFADLEEAYTVKVDPAGSEAKIIGEKQKGYLIDENITYLPKVVEGENETNQVEVSVYQSGKLLEKFRIGSANNNRSPVGLSIYQKSDGDYFGKLYEFANDSGKPEDEKLVQTTISLHTKANNVQTFKSHFDDDDVIKLTPKGTYGMKISEDRLVICPITKYFTGGENCDLYFLKILG